jgi:hypothetical protein
MAGKRILLPILQIDGGNKTRGDKIVTDIGDRQHIGKPGNNPPFYPNGRMDPKQEIIDPNQPGIDIRVQVRDQVAQRLVN